MARRHTNPFSRSEPRTLVRSPTKERDGLPRGVTADIYGFHAVLAALTGGRRKLGAIYATVAAQVRLESEIAAAGLTATTASPDEIARRLPPGAVHQGVHLVAGPVEPINLSDIEARSGLLLVLDQITDPHNVGAILRTAAAFAVDGVVTTDRHAPKLSGVLAKAASGGLDYVPVAQVVNLARALEELADRGWWRVGLDSDGESRFDDAPMRRPVALVLGAEDKGLRRLTREHCDVVARLDMPGPIKSLNVSNACAVALTLARQRVAAREIEPR